jgi:hypothetical protein
MCACAKNNWIEQARAQYFLYVCACLGQWKNISLHPKARQKQDCFIIALFLLLLDDIFMKSCAKSGIKWTVGKMRVY